MFRERRNRGCWLLWTIRNLFPEWYLRLDPLSLLYTLSFRYVRSFFSTISLPLSSSVTLLGRRLDEDRRAFINHPLKRNPWRSIINDPATNHEEVPRPYETHYVLSARLHSLDNGAGKKVTEFSSNRLVAWDVAEEFSVIATRIEDYATRCGSVLLRTCYRVFGWKFGIERWVRILWFWWSNVTSDFSSKSFVHVNNKFVE